MCACTCVCVGAFSKRKMGPGWGSLSPTAPGPQKPSLDHSTAERSLLTSPRSLLTSPHSLLTSPRPLQNEDSLKKCVEDYIVRVEKEGQRYQALKTQAEEKLRL